MMRQYRKTGPLTKREVETYNVIKNFIQQYDYSPSYQEICKKLKIHSISAAFLYTRRLIIRGYLEHPGKIKRGFTVKKQIKVEKK